MPSPPRSLDEAVQRIARALADDDGTGWWGEEECGPGHVDAARRLAEAGGLSVLLERLEEVERESSRFWGALVVLLEAFSRMPDAGLTSDDPRWHWWHETAAARDTARSVLDRLAQGAAAPLPATEGGNDGND